MHLSNIEKDDDDEVLKNSPDQITDSLSNINVQNLNKNYTSALRILNLSGNKVVIYILKI